MPTMDPKLAEFRYWRHCDHDDPFARPILRHFGLRSSTACLQDAKVKVRVGSKSHFVHHGHISLVFTNNRPVSYYRNPYGMQVITERD